jgi:hypothetical protein
MMHYPNYIFSHMVTTFSLSVLWKLNFRMMNSRSGFMTCVHKNHLRILLKGTIVGPTPEILI